MSIDINNLYVSKHDPKLFKTFVSTSTKGVFGDVEVVLSFYISQTGKTIWGELKAYNWCKTIVKCAIKKRVTNSLDETVRDTSKTLLEIAGLSEVSHYALSKIDYRQARELVREVLQQITEVNSAPTPIEVTRDWRLL